jgi:tetratricopeptide (TPR) repeat protein
MPARLYAARGDLERAEASLQRALAIAIEGGSLLFEMWARPALATTYALMDRPQEAQLHLARVEEILAAGEDWRGLVGRAALARAAVSAVTGRANEAAAAFERAVDTSRRYVCPWNEAEAFYLWGWSLRRAGERDLALEKLRAALEIYRRIGVGGPWVKRVHDLERGSETSDAQVAEHANVFHREGEYWTLAYEGRSVRVRDAKGLRDIAMLLASPGREIHVADLIGGAESSGVDVRGEGLASVDPDELGLRASGDSGSAPAIDARARAEYRARLASLNEDLAAAEAANDTGRAAAIREELDFIASELASAFGLGGRARSAGHPVERARKAVTMRMRDALARIDRVHPELGRHLEKSIRTGTFCSYSPVPVPAWSL